MEQNLGEKERKQRLALGILSGLGSVAVYWLDGLNAAAAFLGILSAGFILNYFTCFCGTKKALKSIKNSLERR